MGLDRLGLGLHRSVLRGRLLPRHEGAGRRARRRVRRGGKGAHTMNVLLRRFRDFWFEPAPASRLALLRICFGAFVLWYLLPERDTFMKVAHFDARLFAPVGIIL